MQMEYDDAVDTILGLAPVEIQESVFKRYLPLFAYRPGSTEKLPIADWVEIARSPFAEVAVYNNKTYLFTVPPLLTRNDTLGNLPSTININDVVTQSKLKSDVHENLGEAHFRDHLLNRLPPPPPINVSIALRLNDIFKRYGMPLIPLGRQTSNNAEPKPAQAIYDGYEDL